MTSYLFKSAVAVALSVAIAMSATSPSYAIGRRLKCRRMDEECRDPSAWRRTQKRLPLTKLSKRKGMKLMTKIIVLAATMIMFANTSLSAATFKGGGCVCRAATGCPC